MLRQLILLGSFSLPIITHWSSQWVRQNLQLAQVDHRLLSRCSTHFRGRPQADTHRRALRQPEQLAQVVVGQLDATHAGRFAVRHAGDGRRDRWGDAARPAAGATLNGGRLAGGYHMIMNVANSARFSWNGRGRWDLLAQLSWSPSRSHRSSATRPSCPPAPASI